MIKHFIQITWRNIKSRRFLSLVQVLCLSTGMAAFILIAMYVNYEKDWDKFNTNFDRIYRVQSYKAYDRMDDGDQVPVPLSAYLKEHVSEIENAIMMTEAWGGYLSSGANRVYFERDGYLAPTDVFSLFSFELIRGDKRNVLDKPNSIVLNETLAGRYFPDEDAMGKVIYDDRKQEFVVTGIMKDIPEQSVVNASYFLSSKQRLMELGSNWQNYSHRSFVLLKPNVSAQLVTETIKNVLIDHDPQGRNVLFLKPLNELHLNANARDEKGAVIYMFSFIGTLTLLLACVSFMNLTTSFSTLRRIEIGIRKVVGSGKKFIRWQFLSEAVFLSLISFLVAIVISYLLLPVFNRVVNRNISLQLFDDPSFLLFMLLMVIITGLLAGSYPAMVVSGFKPAAVLKGKIPLKKGRISGLKGMVYFQFILSVILITSSLWMYKQVDYLENKDLGFQKKNLLHCKIPALETNIAFQSVRERIMTNPGVEEMTISYNSPFHSNWGTRINYEGAAKDSYILAKWNRGSSNYLQTMNMQLVEGRNFLTEPLADRHSCLINETAVNAFGWDDPIGKWIDHGEKYTVVGVIKDFNIQDVHNPILPYFLLMHDGQLSSYNDFTFRVNPATLESSMSHIHTILSEMFPSVLINISAYDFGTDRTALRIWTSIGRTFAFFTVLAIIIAALGLFGLVVFATQRRVKEIGIRKVQGAKAEHILPLITKQFVVLVLAANVIVFPVAYLIEKTLPGSFKYHFSIIDCSIVLGITLCITILSSGFQALKASRLNPVEALRYE